MHKNNSIDSQAHLYFIQYENHYAHNSSYHIQLKRESFVRNTCTIDATFDYAIYVYHICIDTNTQMLYTTDGSRYVRRQNGSIDDGIGGSSWMRWQSILVSIYKVGVCAIHVYWGVG